MRSWKNTENAGTSLNAMPRVVVSLTSHTRERLAMLPYFLYRSILQYRLDYARIVLTLYKDDLQYIPDRLRDLINVGLVELITAPVNLRCHLKYFYAMKKYRDLPVITIDDDSIYPKDMIPDLLANAERYPGTIIARSARVIDRSVPYARWRQCNGGVEAVTWRSHYGEIRSDLSPEGYGGVYYPADILKVDDTLIPEMSDFLRADDIYLTWLEQRRGVSCIVPRYDYNKLDLNTRPACSICLQRGNLSMIDSLVRKYL